MNHDMLSIAEAKTRIEEGRILLIAADERALRKLPKGSWIGGTIPYFISRAHGGLVSHDMVFVTDISDAVEKIEIVRYDHNSLGKIYTEGVNHGFSFIVIPARSIAHLAFALNAPRYKDFGARPLIGWIAGVHLDDLGEVTPKVFNGLTGAALSEGALVLRADLAPGKVANVGIFNLFEQGDGAVLTFPVDGFSASDVFVNGEKERFADYIVRNKLDTKLPLVADYYGVRVNTSFQSIDESEGNVSFYAPVFKGIHYKHAKPVDDYVSAFKSRLETECQVSESKVAFSCNCILNYLYSELEGKNTDPFSGPISFGEIAYQLLNQTLVYLEIQDA